MVQAAIVVMAGSRAAMEAVRAATADSRAAMEVVQAATADSRAATETAQAAMAVTVDLADLILTICLDLDRRGKCHVQMHSRRIVPTSGRRSTLLI